MALIRVFTRRSANPAKGKKKAKFRVQIRQIYHISNFRSPRSLYRCYQGGGGQCNISESRRKYSGSQCRSSSTNRNHVKDRRSTTRGRSERLQVTAIRRMYGLRLYSVVFLALCAFCVLLIRVGAMPSLWSGVVSRHLIRPSFRLA